MKEIDESIWADKALKILSVVHKILTAIGALAVLVLSIYGAISSGYGFYVGILVGTVGAMLIVGFYIISGIWNITTDWLKDFVGKYPRFRRAVIVASSLTIFIFIYIVIIYFNINVFFKISLGIFLLTLFPAALVSLIQEDRRRERFQLLGNLITPELIVQSPQAAIEHAFTLFEERLRNRIGADPSTIGEALINSAFGQDGKLLYSSVENENKGVRNLMSGAYATYRNPRKHRVMKDDKENALAIIALIELLAHIIDDSALKE